MRAPVTLAAVCLAAMMFGLEISSVPVILPTLDTQLGARFSDLQWVMNAYTLACTTVLMAVGAWLDRYGRKTLFLTSVTLFGLTSLACGLADSAPLLIVARALQGACGGAMLICQISILSRQFSDPVSRSKAFAWWGVVFGAGLGLGPVIGAGIVALSSWQWVFLVHVPLALLTAALGRAGVQSSRDAPAGKLDSLGIVLLALSVFGLTYLIIQGSQPEMSRATVCWAALATLLTFMVFLISQKLNPQPVIDFSVFRIRQFSGALLGSMGMNFSFWPLMIYLPIYVQTGMGLGGLEGGLLLLAYTLPTLLIPPLAERLMLTLHPGVMIPAGMLAIGAGLMVMATGVANPQWLLACMTAGCLLAGTGLGLTNTPVTNISTGSVPPARTGMASGMDMSARMISLAINIAVMGWILVEGIAASLRQTLPGTTDPLALQAAAQTLAAGKIEVPAATFHAALNQGFGWVLMYGASSVLLLALASFAVFRPWSNMSAATLLMASASANTGSASGNTAKN